MSKFGKEFTGQPFINDREQIVCPLCGKAISARTTGWFDSHCKVTFEPESSAAGGVYVCKSCLSDERKAQILADNPNEIFDSEKNWVDREQESGPLPGPMETLLTSIIKYRDDPEILNGVKSVFEAHAKLKE